MAFYIGEIRKLRNEFLEAYQNGDYKKAVVLGKRLLDIYVENQDCDSMEYAADMNNLALVFDQMQFYDRAAVYYQKAAVLKRDCGGESLSYGDTLNNLAIVYNNMGDQKKALRLHEKVLAIREEKLGKEHRDTVYSLYHLGNTYELMKDYGQALKMQEKALERAGRTKGFSLADLADLHEAQGRICNAMGNYKRSIYYYEVALDLIEKDEGEDTLYYMIHLLLLAMVCEQAGQDDIAVEYSEKAVRIRRGLMGEEQLTFITSLNNLAALCCKAKQFDKAIRYHGEARDMVERLLGKEHPFYADSLMNLSVDYCGKEEFQTALELNQQALAMKRRMFAESDPQIAAGLVSLAILYDSMGHCAEAMQHYRRALEIRRGAMDEPDLSIADTLTGIAKVYEHQEAFEAAAVSLQEALDIRKKLGDENSGVYIWTLQRLAEIRTKQGSYGESVSLCGKAEQTAKKRFGEKHPRYASALAKRGLAYEAAGDLENAAKDLEQAADIRAEMLDEDSPYSLEGMENLARVYLEKGEYEKALRLYREKNDINFEETAEEQREAAKNLMAEALCHACMKNTQKAEAYYKEAEEKLERSGLKADSLYSERKQDTEEVLAGKPLRSRKRGEHPFLKRKAMNADRMLSRIFEESSREHGETDTESVKAALAKADLLNRLGQTEEAAEWFSFAEQHGEGRIYVRACRRLAEYCLKKGDREGCMQRIEQAKEVLEKAGELQTEEYCALMGLLADCRAASGEKEEAAAAYEQWESIFRALHLPVDDLYEERMEHAAKLLAELKRTEEAVGYYSTLALAVRAREGETQAFSRILLKTAALHVDSGKGKEAETLLDRVLLLEDERGTESAAYGKLCDRVGRLYTGAGCLEKAEDALKNAYKIQYGGKKCMTKEGLSMLMGLLLEKGDEDAYFAVKNGGKIE